MFVPVEPRYFSFAERLDRRSLETLQFRKLKRLLAFNYLHNPFYRDLWRASGVTPDDIQSLADYRHKIPMIAKSDVLRDQTEHPPFGRRLGVPQERVRKVHLTSGTSGMAREVWGLTQEDVEHSARGHIQQFHWRGLEPGDVCMISMPKFFSAGIGGTLGAEKFGLVTFELFGMPQDRILSLMLQFKPHFLNFPLAPVLRMLSAEGLTPRETLPRLKAVSVNARPPEDLDAISELWGTQVVEIYGCTQAGNTIAIACEHGLSGPSASPLVHFLEERYLVECLNRETGEPAGPYEECEVVLTTLDRVASPSIRYRLHDRLIFVPHDNCACGRPFHGYRPGSVSRWDDMLKIKGVNCWPAGFDEAILGDSKTVLEYRGRVVSREGSREAVEIDVTFTASAPGCAEWRRNYLRTLAGKIKEKMFITVEISESASPLAEFETMKPRRWQDLRKAR
jgi:phenylacetate-CoA ligase